MVGQTISHYRILEKVGEGGMGVVYKAEDTKLDRAVALKFLPAHLLGNEDVRKRFEREAKSAAALSHPNVCRVYEIDEADGKTFLSMELIDGESLDQKIARGPLKLDEALSIAQQVAKGLEAAHKRGITHRDIKPENIMVSDDGHVTILDFGLAQLTEASRLTKTDEMLGTIAYMSPEQTEGSGADHRTDIWSLGVLLYEMISGLQPFKGDYDRAVMYSILNEEPEPITALRTGVPMELETVISKCLDKDVSRRYQTMADLRVDLERLESPSGSPAAPSTIKWTEPSVVQPVASRTKTPTAIAAGALILLAFWVGREIGKQSSDGPSAPDTPLSRLTIDTGGKVLLGASSEAQEKGDDAAYQESEAASVSVSPDGQTIVFVGTRNGVSRLYRRDLDSLELQPIEGTEGARRGFFSPNGRTLGFLTSNAVKTVGLDGGTPRILCDAILPTDAAWLPNGSILFANKVSTTVFRVGSEGGPVEEAGRLSGACYFSDALTDGRHVLSSCLSRSMSADHADIRAVDLESGDEMTLIENGYGPKLAKDGFILFGRSGDLFAARFDPQTISVSGQPRRVASDVGMSAMFRIVNASASQRGILVYAPGGDKSLGRPAWIDREGAVEVVEGPARHYSTLEVAPDGKGFAASIMGVRDYIQIVDGDRGETLRLEGDGSYAFPRWAKRGNRIAFTKFEKIPGSSSIAIQALGSAWPPVTVATDQQMLFAKTWGPGDEGVLIGTWPEVTNRLVSEAGDLELPKGFEGANFFVDLSPDGRWLAEFTNGHIEVRSVDGERRHQISSSYGIEPRWCQECDELFYRSGNRIYSVKVRFGQDLEWERPELAFEIPGFVDTPVQSFDPSPDGRRVLAVVRDRELVRTRINVVQNWLRAYDLAGEQ